MIFALIDYIFWVVSVALATTLILLIRKRKLFSAHPWFSLFVVVSTLRDVALFCVYMRFHFPMYFYAYWASDYIETALQLLVILEIYKHLFSTNAKATRYLLIPPSLLTFLSVILAVWYPAFKMSRMDAVILTLGRASSFFIASLGLSVFIFASVYRASWKKPTYSIAVGLAIYHCVYIVVGAVFVGKIDVAAAQIINRLPQAAYCISFLVWNIGMYKSEALNTATKPEVIAFFKRGRDYLEEVKQSL